MKIDLPTPIDAFEVLKCEYPGNSFLLESIEGPEKIAKYSFIGFDPIFDIRAKDDKVELNGESKTVDDSYEFLQKKFSQFDAGHIDFLPFSSGMVGYFSYDIVRSFESLPDETVDPSPLPDYHFMIPSQILCFDHPNDKIFLISHGPSDDIGSLIESPRRQTDSLVIHNIESHSSQEEYHHSVERAQEYISQGEIYQVVLSRRMKADIEGDIVHLYRRLRKINPSPYLYYLNFDETNIIGSSPEMLVKLQGDELVTRPLAGTRKRSSDPEEDERLKLDMILDEKERAEHLMLVDLHRNDMGRVSEYGSVKVNELMGVEKYSHVQHMVSNVTAKLRKDKDCFDVLKACFPAGTVTGAPKIRAMEIIDELEVERRGPYGGAVGYFDFSGNMEFAITIRSIFTKGDRAYVQAGAGIVKDSAADKEFVETENKMRAMVRALEAE